MIKVDEQLYRGPRPRNLKGIIDLGIKRIISLESGAHEILTDDPYEYVYPSDYDLLHYEIPMNAIFAPTETQVLIAISKIGPEKTYLHCFSGVDRTGFVCAAYRIKCQGWTFKAAYSEWVSLGRHWWYDPWKWQLRRLAGKWR